MGSSWRDYPPSVFFILGNEFCERFSFYGMKALLTVFFVTEHNFAPSTAVLLYHSFSCIAYVTPLLGSVLADSYVGRYRVILWVSLLYVIGHGLLSFGAVPVLEYKWRCFFDFSGLFVIALSTGGIKPCVSAFAVDQFPDSRKDLRSQFFSFFYFSINAGALIAIIVTPIFKSQVSCFGSDHCFPLAFGVPGLLMLVAFFIFAAGTRFYRRLPPSRHNVGARAIGCCVLALKRRLLCPQRREDHWLEEAAPDYSPSDIRAVRSVVAVGTLFVPMVFFWALFDQKGSTWILLARKLNGAVGPVSVIPEQINFLNPLMIMMFVPVSEAFVYPWLRKRVSLTPLRKMGTGGLLTAASFVMAGLLQLWVNGDLPAPLPVHHSVVHSVGSSSIDSHILRREEVANLLNGTSDFDWKENTGFVMINASGIPKSYVAYENTKATTGTSVIYVLTDNAEDPGKHIIFAFKGGKMQQEVPLETGQIFALRPPLLSFSAFNAKWGHNCTTNKCPEIEIPLAMGSRRVLIVENDQARLVSLVEENRVSILWLIPQYITITMGEVLLSVTGLEFAYSQSPPSMKSTMQALWLMTVFLGNVIDIGISGTHIVSEPAMEFFLYSSLMLLVMLLFIMLAHRYKYHDYDEAEAEEFEKYPLQDQ